MGFFGGGHASSGPPQQIYRTSDGRQVLGDVGLPQDAIDKGYTSQTAYQGYVSQQTSQQQIQAQRDIANQQEAANQAQLKAQQDLQDQQAAAAKAQAERQSTYDTGRAQALSQGTQAVNAAFANFTPDYFKNYVSDYMGQVADQVNYQKAQATKDMLFGLARQGISDSQAKATQTGLIEETAGRTTAEQTAQAQQAAANLQANVAGAKQNLMNQITNTSSLGSPIAASDMPGVNQALQTQQQAISGIQSNAGDVVASLNAVPSVPTLSNIFSGLLTNVGSYLGGAQANFANQYRNQVLGLQGTSPSPGGSTSLRTTN
jgi:hypothetical protein